jgi:hypothetical protein
MPFIVIRCQDAYGVGWNAVIKDEDDPAQAKTFDTFSDAVEFGKKSSGYMMGDAFEVVNLNGLKVSARYILAWMPLSH